MLVSKYGLAAPAVMASIALANAPVHAQTRTITGTGTAAINLEAGTLPAGFSETGTPGASTVIFDGSVTTTANGLYADTAPYDVSNTGIIRGAITGTSGVSGILLSAGGNVVNGSADGGATVVTGKTITGHYGVRITGAGGNVTNYAGNTITGVQNKLFGVSVSTGTITNYGTIVGSGGVEVITGGSVVNSGSITSTSSSSGYGYGIVHRQGGGTVTNTATGVITSTSGAGIIFNNAADAGLIDVNNAGFINGAWAGVVVQGASGSATVVRIGNTGRIIGNGAYESGISVGSSLSGGDVNVVITNAAGAEVRGGYNGVAVGYGGDSRIENNGTISGGNFGVNLPGASIPDATMTVVNGVGGVIESTSTSPATASAGMWFQSSGQERVLHLTNSGTIRMASPGFSGYDYGGVLVQGSATVINDTASALISGGQHGIVILSTDLINTTSQIHNDAGTIEGRGGDGILANGFSSLVPPVTAFVTNGVDAQITGTRNGVNFGPLSTGLSTVVNDGSIIGHGNSGILLQAGGIVTNNATGTIESTAAASGTGDYNGITVKAAAGTITNAGIIRSAAASGIVLAQGGTVTNNGASALIRGQTDGIQLLAGGTVTSVAGSIIGMTGDGVAGAGGAIVDSGAVIEGAVNAVRFTAGDNTLRLYSGSRTTGNVQMGTGADRTTVFNGADISGVGLFSGGVSVAASQSVLAFDGYAGQARAIDAWQSVNVVNGANLHLDGADSHAAQTFDIDAQSALGFATATGTLDGNVVSAGTLDYTSGGGAGVYRISGDLSNAGRVLLSGAVPGDTLTVAGHYTGTDGELHLTTRLNAGGALADQQTGRLIVDGHASGETRIMVNGVGSGEGTSLGGANLASEGISLVQVGGASTAGTFRLGTPGEYVVGGAHQYRLYAYGPGAANGAADAGQNLTGNTNGDHWDYRLQSAYVSPASPDDPLPAASRPALAPQVPTLVNLPLAMLNAGLQDMDMLHRRLGELHDDNALNRAAGRAGDAFLRTYGGQFNHHSNRPFQDYGYDFDQDYMAVQLGANLFSHRDENAALTRVGFALTFGDMSMRTGSPSLLEGTSRARVNTYSLQGYATRQWNSGLYVDAVMSFGLMNGNVTSKYHSSGDSVNGSSFGVSIETGYPWQFATGWTLEPQVQLAYQRLSFDADADNPDDPQDVGSSLGTAQQLFGRLGVRLTRAFAFDEGSVVTPYAKVNLLHGFLDGGRVMIGGETFRSGDYGTALQVGGGMTMTLAGGWSVYGEGVWQTRIGSTGFDGWSANLGVRYVW